MIPARSDKNLEQQLKWADCRQKKTTKLLKKLQKLDRTDKCKATDKKLTKT
jgi:hypothetical protein